MVSGAKFRTCAKSERLRGHFPKKDQAPTIGEGPLLFFSLSDVPTDRTLGLK